MTDHVDPPRVIVHPPGCQCDDWMKRRSHAALDGVLSAEDEIEFYRRQEEHSEKLRADADYDRLFDELGPVVLERPETRVYEDDRP